MKEEINLKKRNKVINYIILFVSVFAFVTFFKGDYIKNLFKDNTKKKQNIDLKIKYDDFGNITEINNGKRIDYFNKGMKIKTKSL